VGVAVNTNELHVMVKEEDGGYWGEVIELPGCFASGRTFEEFREALLEAISMSLPPVAGKPPKPVATKVGALVLQP
jgi:hypothetical protein